MTPPASTNGVMSGVKFAVTWSMQSQEYCVPRRVKKCYVAFTLVRFTLYNIFCFLKRNNLLHKTDQFEWSLLPADLFIPGNLIFIEHKKSWQ